MAKKPETESAEGTNKAERASARLVPTVTVVEGDKRPSDELMKLPKAQIIRSVAVPENKARFIVDVDNRTARGKGIIALMQSLVDGDAAASRAVTEILGALAEILPKKQTPTE